MEEGRELPVGWEIVRLEEIGAWGSGGTPKRTNQSFYANGTIPWLVIGDLNDGLVTTAASAITEEALDGSAAKIIPKDSLLVAMYGSIGKLGITGIECATNQAIAHCKPFRELIELQYLFNALMHVKEDLIAKGQGGAQQNISQGILRDQEIPLAPLNEQRRIAAKLDTALAAVDACRQRLDGVEALLKRFRQAVLAAATSGELTREWREERGAPEWEWLQAADVCEKVQSGGTPKAGFIDEPGVPFLKVYNLVDQSVDFDYRPQYVDPAVHLGPLSKSRAFPGDVLMNIVGPPLGKVAIVPDAHDEWNINQAICLFRPSTKVTTEWLYYMLCEGSNIRKIQLETKGSAGQVNISLTQCRQFEFQVPSIDEQQEISRRLESLFSLADQLEAKLTSARKTVERLTPALLAKAFRGELVPQDPSDEPASVLLERLAAKKWAARQAEAAASGPSRRGRRQAAAKPAQSLVAAAPVSPDLLSTLLHECGALSEKALLAASELDPASFQAQLAHERSLGTIRLSFDDGQEMLEAVGGAAALTDLA